MSDNGSNAKSEPMSSDLKRASDVMGDDAASEKVSRFNPELQRYGGIKDLMKGEATLSRISQQQIVLEALVNGALELGYHLPASKELITTARNLSPGLDGLGRGEAVKCLVAYANSGSLYPAQPFPEQQMGAIARFIAFLTGKKPNQ